ncbi:glycosyl hydrolase-related protein [Streptomyces sp. M10(2022)]
MASALPSLITTGHPAVTVESVKLAEDRSADVIVRLYESAGGRADSALRVGFPSCGRRSPICWSGRCTRRSPTGTPSYCHCGRSRS